MTCKYAHCSLLINLSWTNVLKSNRTRRVKCDETFPNCTRCLKHNGICGGYPLRTKKRRVVPHQQPIAPRFTGPGHQISYQPSAVIFRTSLEQEFFHFFVNKVSYQLSGYLDSKIWTKLVLQACHVNPAVVHGVVAISALSFLDHTRSKSHELSCDEKTRHRHFALKQYDTSIKELRIAAVGTDRNLQTMLITCIVIICFENLYGNASSALAQIKAGLNLIFDERPFFRQAQLDVALTGAFARLDLHSMTFIDTRSQDTHLRMQYYGQDAVDTMPEEFTAIDQAKNYLVLLMQRIMHFMATFEASMGFMMRGWRSRCPCPLIPQAEIHVTDLVPPVRQYLRFTVLRLRALRKDRMVNNDGNASSSEAIDNVIFRLKCIRWIVHLVR